MELPFTFSFQLQVPETASSCAAPQANPLPPGGASFVFSVAPENSVTTNSAASKSNAAGQARYPRKEKTCLRMQKLCQEHHDEAVQAALRRRESSDKLRVTCAPLRLTREKMLWVNVDKDNAMEMAELTRIISSSAYRKIPDDEIEWIFRRVMPLPGEVEYGDLRNIEDYDYGSRELLPPSPHLMSHCETDGCEANNKDDQQDVSPEQEKLARKRCQARDRMARHRAIVKNMPLAQQQEVLERARAARVKHRLLLLHKERVRRMEQFAKEHGPDTTEEHMRRWRRRYSRSYE
ncbi:hypothetical protein C8J57DRAFT_1251786 [Mycena rebaudengoi]|nr:hypothetical protein C8J57DRAFT_1251786 [Mycena rebaudengoi]